MRLKNEHSLRFQTFRLVHGSERYTATLIGEDALDCRDQFFHRCSFAGESDRVDGIDLIANRGLLRLIVFCFAQLAFLPLDEPLDKALDVGGALARYLANEIDQALANVAAHDVHGKAFANAFVCKLDQRGSIAADH